MNIEHRILNVQLARGEQVRLRRICLRQIEYCILPVVSFCVERPISIKNEEAFVAEIAMQANSESILHAGYLQSVSEDSTFKPLQAGINPATTHEALAKK